MSVKTKQRLLTVYSSAMRLVCAIVLWIGVYAAIFQFAYSTIDTVNETGYWLYMALWLCIYLLMSLPCIVIHEAGHLLGGLLSGYRFCSFRVLSFMLIRLDGRLQLKRMKIAGTGGQCQMDPPLLKEGRFPFILYYLFGPLANGIAAAAALAVILTHWVEWMYIWDPIAVSVLNIFLLMNLYYMLLNGIPMRTRYIDNDGMQLVSLLRRPECARYLHHSLRIASLMAQGVPERDLPKELFEMPPDHLLQTSRGASAAVLACAHRCALDDHESARAMIIQLLEDEALLTGSHRCLLRVLLIAAELLGENRRDQLDVLMTKPVSRYLRAMSRDPSILAVQYMWALLHDDDASKAESIQKRFETIARTYPYPASLESDRKMMEKALARWEQEKENDAQTIAD